MSSVWLDVDLRMDIKTICVYKRLHNMFKNHYGLNSHNNLGRGERIGRSYNGSDTLDFEKSLQQQGIL